VAYRRGLEGAWVNVGGKTGFGGGRRGRGGDWQSRAYSSMWDMQVAM